MAHVRIDTGTLAYPKFLIPGHIDDPVDGGAGVTVSLEPGHYRFDQSGPGFAFEITVAGLIEYSAANDQFLTGRGTDVLTVTGFPVTVNLTGLSHDLAPRITGNPGPLTRSGPHVLRLVPGTYRYLLARGLADFSFVVKADGTLGFSDPALNGCARIEGRTLTITGYAVTFDLTALSHDLQAELLGDPGHIITRDVPHTLHLIPGSYAFLLARGIANFCVTLTRDGRLVMVDLHAVPAPALNGCARIEGRTLTITGYAVTFDLTALSHDLQAELLGDPGHIITRDVPHTLHLIPGSYAFLLARGIADFRVTVTADGQLALSDPALTGCAQISNRTLTIRGYAVTFDLTALSHDLQAELLGDPRHIITRETPHTLRLIPGDYAYLLARGLADFRIGLTRDGRAILAPRHRGFAQAAGRTVTVWGYPVTIDGRTLSDDLSPTLLGNSSVLSRTSTHVLTLVPSQADYRFFPLHGIGTTYSLTLDVAGKVAVTPDGLRAHRTVLVSRVFDDFTTGPAGFTVAAAATETARQSGAMLGGTRSLTIGNAGSQPVRLDVGGPDRLRLSPGTGQRARLAIEYGRGADGAGTPLALNLRDGEVDRLRITVPHLDGDAAELTLTVVTAGGQASASTTVDAGYTDLPFADLRGPAAADLTDVQGIVFEFHVGGPLTVDRIETAGPPRLSQLMLWRSAPAGDTKMILAVHAALLHTNEILLFGGDEHDPGRHFLGNHAHPTSIDTTRIYDCATGALRIVDSPPMQSDGPAPDLFCCGHAFLSNGHLLVAGGTETWKAPQPGDPAGAGGHHMAGHFTGLRYTWDFDPDPPDGRGHWTRTADMSLLVRGDGTQVTGRWYPTLVTLSDGSLLALSGHVAASPMSNPTPTVHTNTVVEVFTGEAWRARGELPLPLQNTIELSYYPRLFLLPNGEVFSVSAMRTETPVPGQNPMRCQAWRPNPPGWRDVAPRPPEDHSDEKNLHSYEGYNRTAVLLPLVPPAYKPQILICGGFHPHLIEPLSAGPEWRPTSARQPVGTTIAPARFDATAVILPTKEVLLSGGFNPATGSVMVSEVFDPATRSWSTLPDGGTASVPRGYHSVVLLMPDGRVFTAGTSKGADWSYHTSSNYLDDLGNPKLPPPNELPHNAADPDPAHPGQTIDNRELVIEIYEPPYFSRPDRPLITSAPETITYDTAFAVKTPDSDRIRDIALLRAGSTTHAFNSDQRYVGLRFTRGNGELRVSAPRNGNLAPPGWYLLFVVAEADGQPVPSIGRFIHLPMRTGVRGVPALIQSTFGQDGGFPGLGRGEFDFLTPFAAGGLDRWSLDNNGSFFWAFGEPFGQDSGIADAVTMIQSRFVPGDFGHGNFEAVARFGDGLVHFTRDHFTTPFTWRGPIHIARSGVRGTPALIESSFGQTPVQPGNLELVAPMADGGLAHFWRGGAETEWLGTTTRFGGTDPVEAVSMIQSNFFAGNLEVVARIGEKLVHFSRGGPGTTWHGPTTILDGGASGNPVLIQGNFGQRGNFELVTPMADKGLAHLSRDNDNPALPWSALTRFGTDLGHIDAVTMIQSNFLVPQNLEVIARVGNQLYGFTRDAGPAFHWHSAQVPGYRD
ncbi:galactose oxidase early set domain-containing protein [Nocardia aurantia]|uniref:Galactose oxidase-like Early set domain-containing protein n=1 Tax=Nocardia aurantia TaxID=2585199 RepID=A0A7K0DPI6_9NOCA|nr:galactose oxidase early set domain-containing protein [Nocardia aurantia]MQY27302.1 hypothetical protein [Nocardia aurantia]